jgi:hypothetical protein
MESGHREDSAGWAERRFRKTSSSLLPAVRSTTDETEGGINPVDLPKGMETCLRLTAREDVLPGAEKVVCLTIVTANPAIPKELAP